VESFDVILAPFTSAPERTLDVEQVEQLVKLLIPHRVAILGGGTNPNVSLTVPHFYDYPFDYAAQLLRQAKVVVAVDSFPGRLAHAAGVKHHIVLDTGATPITTQVYPGAIPMPAYGIEAVAAKVRSLLSAPLS
jgi:ADP-heptose:LPS heptosyltransferase